MNAANPGTLDPPGSLALRIRPVIYTSANDPTWVAGLKKTPIERLFEKVFKRDMTGPVFEIRLAVDSK